jgi:glycogen debranching enzyme
VPSRGSPIAEPTQVPGLDELLAAEGWPYASAQSVGPDDPGRFHALFGRDSLITSLQLLPVRPDVAAATLRALAALQGTRADGKWDEEPGKIVHEVREGVTPERADYLHLHPDGPQLRYYGSADGTSWFLHVLGATGDAALADELEPAWRAAGAWLLGAIQRGDGLVRFDRREPGGLVHQGWRDTVDPLAPEGNGGGLLHEDGSAPPGPIADADTQAAALAGLRALARLSGDEAHARAVDTFAATVAGRFDAETLAIDGEDRPVRGAGSQLGWLLWAGAEVPGAAERLSRPDVLTDFGLRTLSSEAAVFDPFAYHRGTIWPFDSWLGWAGLRAAGADAAAERVRAGVLRALRDDGRYPELYAVTGDGVERVPIANHVQAWTVGAAWALENEWDGGAHVVA